MKRNTTRQRRLLHIGGGLVFAVLCILIGYAFYSMFAPADKQRFETVESDMKALQSMLDKTNSWTLDSTCRRSHEVYNEGPLSCEVHLKTLIPDITSASARKAVESFRKHIGTSGLFKTNASKAPELPTFIHTLQAGYDGEAYTHVKTGMRCSSLIEIKSDAHTSLKLDLMCSDAAKDTYYPRSDI